MSSRLLSCRISSWRAVVNVSRDVLPSPTPIFKPCFRWAQHGKIRLSRAQTKERLLVDSHGQPLNESNCFTKPKSTSTLILEETVDSAEEPHNLPKEALKKEDFENEWMEQKVDLEKLPQQYMQLSKIRLTGCINIS
ncbi:PREDICTED: uncharacterized protein LOC107342408 [Acropora digitifera]|uniref:uncharacterized protein LOC107342408 n=1 Tax=Acropora digitifera TaxID=70779 RepID=UPI00077AFC15|nr:PREDICTED: uncharacterized protein LOC107342408 [Acropora digitifera]